MGPGMVMLRVRPASGVRHAGYPEYLNIYRLRGPFLDNSHVLSGHDRQPYATRFTLCEARLTRGYKGRESGAVHRAEIRHVAVRKSSLQCDLTHMFPMQIYWNLGYIFPYI
jgi:hypothetical protein